MNHWLGALMLAIKVRKLMDRLGSCWLLGAVGWVSGLSHCIEGGFLFFLLDLGDLAGFFLGLGFLYSSVWLLMGQGLSINTTSPLGSVQLRILSFFLAHAGLSIRHKKSSVINCFFVIFIDRNIKMACHRAVCRPSFASFSSCLCL